MPELNIVVVNQLADRHLAAISNAAPNSRVITCELSQAEQHMADADILIAWGWMDIRPIFQKAPKLKWVHTLSAGVEKMLFPEMQSSSTILTNSRGIHGIPMSEHVLAMILTFTRGLNILIRNQDNKKWKRTPTDEIYGKTMGIVGLGSIGREIAKRAKGLGMQVVATKREMTSELFVDQLYTSNQLTELLAVSDFVVVTLPLTEETKELFTLDLFKTMKRSAYFLNVARGAVVKEADLTAALEQGLIKGAGLDVFEHEPLPEHSPLWNMPNVIITPHIAAISPYYLDRAVKLFADNLNRFVQNGEMLNVIDKAKGY